MQEMNKSARVNTKLKKINSRTKRKSVRETDATCWYTLHTLQRGIQLFKSNNIHTFIHFSNGTRYLRVVYSLLYLLPYCLQFSLHTIIIIITLVVWCTSTLLSSVHDFMAFHCFAFCNVIQKSTTTATTTMRKIITKHVNEVFYISARAASTSC